MPTTPGLTNLVLGPANSSVELTLASPSPPGSLEEQQQPLARQVTLVRTLLPQTDQAPGRITVREGTLQEDGEGGVEAMASAEMEQERTEGAEQATLGMGNGQQSSGGEVEEEFGEL
jgi:hypothetical protein